MVCCFLSISLIQSNPVAHTDIDSSVHTTHTTFLKNSSHSPFITVDENEKKGVWSQIVGDNPNSLLKNGFNNSHNINVRGKSTFIVNDTEYLLIGTGNINKEQKINKSVFFPLLKAGVLLTKLLLKTGYHYCSKILVQRQKLLDLFVIDSIETYFKQLSSDGCELWYFNEKYGWNQSVGNTSHACIPRGFNNTNNLELTLLTPFQTKDGTDYLYAGTWNPCQGCEVWRTTDPIKGRWEPIIHLNKEGILASGFGNSNNTAAYTAAILDNWLYIGTMNWENGCEIWRTDGEVWQQIVGGSTPKSTLPNGFSKKNRLFDRNIYAWEMCVYNDSKNESLYVGTFNIAGCELWRTTDGIAWECLVGDNRELKRGFTQMNMPVRLLNYGIRRMKVYNDELYIGTASTPSFHLRFNNIDYNTLDQFTKIKEVLSPGFEIWRFNGKNFTKVIGKTLSEQDDKNVGFNDKTNTYCWSMEVYNDLLFVGTMNPGAYVLNLTEQWKNLIQCNISFEFTNGLCDFNAGGGCEVWFTDDGDQWRQMIGDEVKLTNSGWLGNGFNDHNNIGARLLIHYNDKLYAGVMNGVEGCEVWAFDGSNYPKKIPIRQEKISFESNGYTLYGELYYPNIRKESYPAVIFCEGLPAYVSAYSWFAKSLAEKGYVVLLFDPPGLGRSEGCFQLRNISFPKLNLFFRFGSYAETPYHYLFRHWSQATSDALTFLLNESSIRTYINHEQIGVVGHSLGGITATETVAKDPRFQAVVALSHANPFSMRKINIPIQFICGQFDIALHSLPISLYAYKRAQVPKELIILRFGNHLGFTEAFGEYCPCPESQKAMVIRYATGWLDYFLLNKQEAFSIITSKTAYVSNSAFCRYNFDGEDKLLT